MKNSRNKKPFWNRVLIVLLLLLLVPVILVAGVLTFLTVTEYKPADRETMVLSGDGKQTVTVGDSISVMSWNIGYGALGDNADFFMDGGEMVMTASEDRVRSNLEGVMKTVRKIAPDVAYFQEVDSDSKRSYHIDETALLEDLYNDDMETEALYYSVAYVPYPVSPIGEVHTNLQTLSKFDLADATRIQLPVPFSWPVRTANLKRCLLVSRVPLKGSDKELVLVNLHLEAYDSGEGKVAQTKMLLDVLQSEYDKGNYVIAAGDFNQAFSNTDMSAYPSYEGMWTPGVVDVSDFAPDFTLVMDPATPTCRSLDKPLASADQDTFQYYMIDGFIVSKNLTVDAVKTIDTGFVYTDHNPVVLEATLR